MTIRRFIAAFALLAGWPLAGSPAAIEMVPIEGGCFEMGSPPGEAQRDGDETLHRVCVGAFSIGKYEVTQAEWQAVMGSNPSRFRGERHPVELVSWGEAMAFVEKLNAATGQRYRLPTEAEWEFACRAGGAHRYCGGEDIDALAWYGRNSGWSSNPVGDRAPNAFGLHDMSGNVREWTCSVYARDFDGEEARCAPPSEAHRVTRGGSWDSRPWWVRAANRVKNLPNERDGDLGLRLVLDGGE